MGVVFTRSSNCVARHVSTENVFRKAVWGEYSDDLRASDCDFVTTEPQRAYMEWWFGVSDSIGGMFTRCKIDSPYLQRGFETFRSNGISFIDYESRNATFASNSIGISG